MSHVRKKHMTRWGLEPRTYCRSCEYSEDLAIGQHDKSVNSTIGKLQGSGTPSKVCGLPRLSGKMWKQTPISGLNFVR